MSHTEHLNLLIEFARNGFIAGIYIGLAIGLMLGKGVRP